MPIICRLLELTPEQGASLTAHPNDLDQVVAASRSSSDVYRYWHAIEYLLAWHRPDSVAAQWLELGQAVATPTQDLPASRLLPSQEVVRLDEALDGVEPEDLGPHYDASALDQAGVYPRCWQTWEETFDPLGQVLEHYWFLWQFVRHCRANGAALVLYFTFLDDGSDT